MLVKFALTATGRAAGRPRPVAEQISPSAQPAGPAPGLDDVLNWIVALESSHGARALAEGSLLNNQAIADFGSEQLDAVARRLLDLRDAGLVLFDDPAATLDQIGPSDRLGLAGDFRATVAGRDRVIDQRPVAAGDTYVTQIVHAVNAQVAAGDIKNFVSFQALLDRAEQAIDALDDIDEETREEARGLLDKLRGASGQGPARPAARPAPWSVQC